MKVLLFNIRGLRPAFLGCYGNEWIETPAFDQLAAEGIVLDWHYADHPDPAAAPSWRTGCYHLPPLPGEPAARNDSSVDVIKLLQQRGVVAWLIHDPRRPALPPLARGWDNILPIIDSAEGTAWERTLETVLEAVEQLMHTEHWLLWVESAYLLPPWELPAEYTTRNFDALSDRAEPEEDEEAAAGAVDDEEPDMILEPWFDPPPGPLDDPDGLRFLRLQRTYAAVVSFLDSGLGLLWEELEQRGWDREITLAVTSDHGLPLGEHGVIGAEQSHLHEELIHLPFVARLPGAVAAGRRVAALTQPLDWMPTLLEWFGVPAPETHGHSLVPLFEEEDRTLRPYACAGKQTAAGCDYVMRSPDWSLLASVGGAAGLPAKLFLKPEDVWEVNDVAPRMLEWSEKLEQTLRAFVRATHQTGPLRVPEPPAATEAEAPEDRESPSQTKPKGASS
ncbi:MAG: sulfatase-like hydrolase/transferase [Gemmataceae bacterium]